MEWLDVVRTWLAIPAVHNALVGFWAAFVVDLVVWLKAEGWVVETFDFPTASKRWIAGLITGALAGLGVDIVALGG